MEETKIDSRDLRDKSIYFGNAQGEALPLSVEEALGSGRMDMRGWYCALGAENIHISSDGNIFGAACRNSGFLGNVYEHSFKSPREWHRCTRAQCSCGADMQLRKVKDLADVPLTYEDMPSRLVKEMADASYMAPIHQDMHRRYPLTLTWDLGRRCNYSCSYCHPAISNSYEAHRSWGSLIFALDGLDRLYLRGRKAKFTFTGGEPTINPAYSDFVRLLHERGHLIHTTTNGSRLPEYYADLLEVSLIGFSYHMEFAKVERMKAVLAALVARKKTHQQAAYNWCAVRIMVPPGKLGEAVRVREELLSVDSVTAMGVLVCFSPCYDRKEHTRLMPYEPGELRAINQYG